MTENKKVPENAENKPLTDDQPAGVTDGEAVKITFLQPIEQPTGFKRCAADPTHVFAEIHDACPICGSKEFSFTSY